ncbi:MAG: hypothetical protein AAF750_02885 [Planctomycetota bacterium]
MSLSKPTRPYSPSNNRPQKMALHKALAGIQMNWAAKRIIQEAAAFAEPLYELLEAYRDDTIEKLMPARPEQDRWFALYRDHRALTTALDDLSKDEDGTLLPKLGVPLQELLDETRAISTWAREDPEDVKTFIRENVSMHKFVQGWRVGMKQQQRLSDKHLLRLGRELRGEEPQELPGLDDKLRTSPELYFYMRVCLPAVLLFKTTPIRELRRLRVGRTEEDQVAAVEHLVRIDPLASGLPEVREWINVEDGEARHWRENQVRAWADTGLGGDRFSQVHVKQFVGAMIQETVKEVGKYVVWGKPEVQQASINAAQVLELFHAVAKDRIGRGKSAQMELDRDLADLQPRSWSRQLQRLRPMAKQLLSQPGRLNSG